MCVAFQVNVRLSYREDVWVFVVSYVPSLCLPPFDRLSMSFGARWKSAYVARIPYEGCKVSCLALNNCLISVCGLIVQEKMWWRN